MSKRFIPPHKKGFTLYSISNCKYCKMSCDKIKSDKKVIYEKEMHFTKKCKNTQRLDTYIFL